MAMVLPIGANRTDLTRRRRWVRSGLGAMLPVGIEAGAVTLQQLLQNPTTRAQLASISPAPAPTPTPVPVTSAPVATAPVQAPDTRLDPRALSYSTLAASTPTAQASVQTVPPPQTLETVNGPLADMGTGYTGAYAQVQPPESTGIPTWAWVAMAALGVLAFSRGPKTWK